MIVRESELLLPALPADSSLLKHFAKGVEMFAGPGAQPIRFAVTHTTADGYRCELATVEEFEAPWPRPIESIFSFTKRGFENTDAFTAVLLVPTGIGAEFGGHAGDAGPIAKLLAAVCDTVITHPNVVNASDINEIPENALYVEGSVICRLLMGTVGLAPVRSNRVLVILDAHENEGIVNTVVNAVSAARATYGLSCPRVVLLDPPIRLAAKFTKSGTAAGSVEGLERICKVLDMYQGEYDAVALASVIDVPASFHMEYFQGEGRMVNPWGGVEAMLTHAISSLYDVPSAHSPMFESDEIADLDPGIVDPRMAAEAVSLTFLQCTLKGLQRSPRLIRTADAKSAPITAADISCLVLPEGCVGLPTLAALEQGIPVIAVRENRNLMRNDLANLPWQNDKYYSVDNYWEAAGIIAALRAGISPASARRPLQGTNVARVALTRELENDPAITASAAQAN
jgi:hypothetical protein